MLTDGVGGEAPRAGGPSSPRLRPPLQGEKGERERRGALNSSKKEGKPGGGRAWAEAQQKMLGKEGVAVPLGASKIATHPLPFPPTLLHLPSPVLQKC